MDGKGKNNTKYSKALHDVRRIDGRCSDQEDIGSFTTSDTADGSASFTVGITRVQTWVRGDFLPFLGNMYVGGYDVDYSEEEGVSFSWKGPFG